MDAIQTPWQDLVAKKHAGDQGKVPVEWTLDPKIIASIPTNAQGGKRLIDADVPRKSGILSETELEITEKYTASKLLELLASRKLSSVQVTTAFSKRAAIAQQLTSCLTETLYAEGLERAKFLDDYLAREGKVIGPLHGLPISLKDSFKIKGTASTIGYVAFLNNPIDTKNSALVDLLLDLGAVLYVKTNIPQTLMTADSHNNIFGRTLNPHNTNLTAGGSSGGEGALIAFRGSLLGVGTDAGGSIRIPGICCGTYSFRPSGNRVPYANQATGSPLGGLPDVTCVAGPLASSMEDLELFMKVVLNGHPERYDTQSLAVPWLEPEYKKTLTIGILPEDPFYPLHPPIKRALSKAADELAKNGVKIVPVNFPDLSLGCRIGYQMLFLNPEGRDIMAESGEPVVPSKLTQSSPMHTGPLPAEGSLLHKIFGLFEAQRAYSDAWRKVWEEVDIVLGPGAQNTAVPHDTFSWPFYTALFNLLDYPAAIIPYSKSSKEEDPEPFQVPKESGQPNYDPEALDGMPCHVQVVANKFKDEQCLWASKLIDSILNKKSTDGL